MRTYETTHPWLTFTMDLRHASAKFWTMLGECQSKCEHIAGVPLRPEVAQRLHRLYLAKGVLATTAIEGNTLSEEEVLRHLEGTLRLPPSREYLAQEIDNIVAGCNVILEDITQGRSLQLTVERIKQLNQLVLANLKLEEHVVPGAIRSYSVGVARYKGAPHEDCAWLLQQLCAWLGSEALTSPEGMRIVYAILKAVIAHLYLAWIHPFGDGNGRTARLIEVQLLLGAGVPAPAAHLLSNHYNQTRTEYYRQLDQAGRSSDGVMSFVLYAVQGFLDGLRAQLELIRGQQWDVAWRNYVHERFSDHKSPSAIRQRHLVLDLSIHTEPVPLAKLPEVSPRVAIAYARKTSKTLSRDVNALVSMELIAKEANGFRAHREAILAFLPPRMSPG